jgi:hypothetical protein
MPVGQTQHRDIHVAHVTSQRRVLRLIFADWSTSAKSAVREVLA